MKKIKPKTKDYFTMSIVGITKNKDGKNFYQKLDKLECSYNGDDVI